MNRFLLKIYILFLSFFILLNIAKAQHYYKLNHKQPPELKANAGENTTIDINESVELGGSPTAIGGTPTYTYLWEPTNNLNNANISNPIATPTENTTYALTVIDSKLCSASDTVQIIISDIINTDKNIYVSKKLNFNIQCFNDVIVLYLKVDLKEINNISIFNLAGKRIFEKHIHTFDKEEEAMIFDAPPKGLYLLRVESNNNVKTKKFVIK